MVAEQNDKDLSRIAPGVDPSQIKRTGPDDVNREKSWGDRFKHKMFGILTYFDINYIVNAAGSAWLTYGVERLAGHKFVSASQKVGQWAQSRLGIPSAPVAGGSKFVIRAFFLTSVGNALVPVIKYLEDRRRRIEFKFGHWLDKTQEMLGRGNTASRQNLEDYDVITKGMRQGSAGKLSRSDLERIRIKDHVETNEAGKLAFKEHKLPWSKVLASRFVGWLAAIITNSGFGASNSIPNEKLRYGHWENKVVPKIENGFLRKIPGFTKVIKDPNYFAKMVYNDFLLSISSSVTHKITQGFLHKPDEVTEQKIKKIEKIEERQEEGVPSPDALKALISKGKQDYRTQEAMREENRNEAYQGV